MTKKVFIVDGSKFSTLTEATAILNDALGLDGAWNGNLDALNDILSGGFGTPDEGFVLVWRNSALSRDRLGHSETLRWLQRTVRECHQLNIPNVRQRIAAAEQGKGETLFDALVEIICGHEEIELRLE